MIQTDLFYSKFEWKKCWLLRRRFLSFWSFGGIISTAKLKLTIINLDWPISQVFVKFLLRHDLGMCGHLPDIDATAFFLLLGSLFRHLAMFMSLVNQHWLRVFEVRVRHHWWWQIRCVGIGIGWALTDSSLLSSSVGCKSFTSGAIGKIVFNVSVQKKWR